MKMRFKKMYEKERTVSIKQIVCEVIEDIDFECGQLEAMNQEISNQRELISKLIEILIEKSKLTPLEVCFLCSLHLDDNASPPVYINERNQSK